MAIVMAVSKRNEDNVKVNVMVYMWFTATPTLVAVKIRALIPPSGVVDQIDVPATQMMLIHAV